MVEFWLVSACFYVCCVCNVFGEAPDNIGQEKIMFNVVLILLGQHYLGQNLMQYCPRGSRQHCVRQKRVQCCLNTCETILHRPKSYTMLSQEDSDNNGLEGNLFNSVLILPVQHCTSINAIPCFPIGSRQHCIRKYLLQFCLNALGTTLHRSSPMQCYWRSSRQHWTSKNPVQCCLNTLGKNCIDQNPVQWCPRGSTQTTLDKKPVQYCLNTLRPTLHRSKPYAMLSEKLQTTFHKKNPLQYCLNTHGTTLYRKNPMQFWTRVFKQHSTRQNPGNVD